MIGDYFVDYISMIPKPFERDIHVEIDTRFQPNCKCVSLYDVHEDIIRKLNGKNMEIKRVIFNDPATIVLWEDGTKTVVKTDGEPFDEEKGLAMAIAKKALGNKGNYFNVFRRWIHYDD